MTLPRFTDSLSRSPLPPPVQPSERPLSFYACGIEGGMEADDPSRQRGLYPGAVQGLTPRDRSVGVDSRFTGTRWGFCLKRVQGCEIMGS